MNAQLGKYQLVAEIARGGMGIVYLAVTQGPARFSKLLVVKELKPDLVDDETFLDMFLEEARLAARLNHPNIVQTYEVGEENKRHFIVMDYLDGVTLARVLRRKPPPHVFSRNMHLRVICEILAGLHYAHTLKDFDGTDLGIVHRDVTPQNVFITFDGTAKVVDFGIAKALDSGLETRTGVLKGKPAYMAPEQIAGDVDRRADVFSAGVMIWEAIAGKRMWSKKGDVEVLTSMLKGEVPSIREHAPDVPEELARIVERSLLKDREARFDGASALQDALEEFLRDDPTATMREVGRAVGEIFADERMTTRATIDTCLARLKGGSVGKLPSLLPPRDPKAGDSPGSGSGRVPTSGVSSVSGVSSASSLSSPSSLGTLASASLSSLQARDDAAPVSEITPSNRRTPWIIGAAALLLTGGGFAIGMRARTKPTPLPPAPSALVVSEAPDDAEPTPTLRQPIAEPSRSASVKAPPAQTASIAARPRVTTSPPPARPVWTPPPRQPPARPTGPTPPSTAETKAPEPVDDGKGKTGYLTIDTYPWTRVSTGGRVLGDTPLVRVPLSVGTHVLVLENTEEKVKQTTVVTIKSGETISRRLAF